MTTAELETLVAQGEGPTLEFKRSTGTLKAAFHTLCAFLNGAGGTVAIGVGANGKLVGQEVADRTLQEIARFAGELEPPVPIASERVALGEGKEVLLLRADPRQAEGPVTFDGRPYERVENTTRRMPKTTYERLLKERAPDRYRWENQPAERFTIEDLDHEWVHEVIRLAARAGRLRGKLPEEVPEILEKLEVLEDDQLLNAAVALFAYPEARRGNYLHLELRMARFRGHTKKEFLDRKDAWGGAFHLLEEGLLFCDRHLPLAGKVVPETPQRQDRLAIPRDALREVLVNALIHRDYRDPGMSTYLAIFDDRVEITSPGLLPPGIAVDELSRMHRSHLRNRRIAAAFYRADFIEMWGRGTLDVIEAATAADLDTPVFQEIAGYTDVTFPVEVGHTSPARGLITPDALKTARKRAGWTQAELASRLGGGKGVSKMAVSQWERSVKPIPGDRQAQLRQLLEPFLSE